MMKKCPFCAEEIQDDALKCKHCGEWLDNRNNKSLLSVTKDVFNKSGDFIKSQIEKQKENRYKHLYIPSSDNPLELNGTLFFNDYLEYNNSKYLFSEVESLKFFSKVSNMNGINTERETELVLYFNSTKIDLSRSSFMGIGAGKKTREKMIFIYDYLCKTTFDSRLEKHLQKLITTGYFDYPPDIRIFNNGDIARNEKVFDNLYSASQEERLDYCNIYFSSFLGRSQFYDPYSMYIWANKDSSKHPLFSKHIEISLYTDKDVFDALMYKLINNGNIL